MSSASWRSPLASFIDHWSNRAYRSIEELFVAELYWARFVTFYISDYMTPQKQPNLKSQAKNYTNSRIPHTYFWSGVALEKKETA